MDYKSMHVYSYDRDAERNLIHTKEEKTVRPQGREQSDAITSQGMMAATGSWKPEEAGNNFSSRLWRAQGPTNALISAQ